MNTLRSPLPPQRFFDVVYFIRVVPESARVNRIGERRPVLSRSDYVLVEHGLGSAPCTTCGEDHGDVYTIGCSHPAAFRVDQAPRELATRPVVGTAPIPVMMPCGAVGIHGHDEPCVTWVD